jgi:hypothetical protein
MFSEEVGTTIALPRYFVVKPEEREKNPVVHAVCSDSESSDVENG